ncbi:MAG: dTMP kinase [Victivallales bacterium]|jgi:dTMP kinase|nr:dTMP kinase [Victivallales bacterium]
MENNTAKQRYKGFFITFEGPEGSGKSTQARKLAEFLTAKGREVLLTREPGGTPLAELLRKLVKNFEGEEVMHADTELLLIEAARVQHVQEKILPALQSGKVVICDRFADSTTAYQGGARGIDPDSIAFLNRLAMAQCVPDLTFLLDLPPNIGFARANERKETKGEHDRFEEEQLNFHLRVRNAFLAIAEREPSRMRLINADRDPDTIYQEIRAIADKLVR